jgi:chromosomal replication initiation ATPase DnaA
VRAFLRESVGESQYEIWLAPLELIAVDGGTLVVAAPAATTSWVRSRFGRLLGAASERVGRSLRTASEVERAAVAQLRDGAPHLGDGSPTVGDQNGRIAADRSPPGRMIGAMAHTPAYTQVHQRAMEVS